MSIALPSLLFCNGLMVTKQAHTFRMSDAQVAITITHATTLLCYYVENLESSAIYLIYDGSNAQLSMKRLSYKLVGLLALIVRDTGPQVARDFPFTYFHPEGVQL